MALVASDIITDVQQILLDDDAVDWTNADMLRFVTDAGRLLSNYKPDAYPVRDWVNMVAGTNQALPADGIAVLDMSQNYVSKRAATLVDKELLDHENRFWQANTEEVDVQHWCADPRDPRRFDINPPNDGTGRVLMLYGAAPPVLTQLTDAIVYVDTYKYALTCFTLHRAYAEQSRKGDNVKSQQWLQNGLQAIGIKSAAQVQVAPKVSANPGQ
jgi:hypothetical protein